MRERTLDEVMIRVVADLAGVRLARLPNGVKIEKGDMLRGGAVRVRPIVEPGPILLDRVQIEGGSVLSGGVRGSDTSHTPTQLHIRLLKFLAMLLELAEERTRLRDSVSNGNFQLTDPSRSSEMTDNVDSVALLETDERGRQNFFSDVGNIWDRSQHPIHAGTHSLEPHVHFPSVCKLRPQRGEFAVMELRSNLSYSSNHKVETGLIIQLFELFLLPALSGLHRVFVEVAPSGLDRLRGNVVNLSGREQLQRPRHKSFAASWCLLFDKKRIGREFSGGG